MSIDTLKGYIFASKYASWNDELQRLETRDEATDRVLNMHRARYAEHLDVLEPYLAKAEKAMKAGLLLGSQRALQFGGPAILKKHARIYNCTTSYCDRPRFFQECLWLLLCGCGTGFSVQRHHVEKLPNLVARHSGDPAVFVVPDTIEGWADSIGVLMASYGIVSPGLEGWRHRKVTFDLSKIRPQGAHLSSGLGVAPGPDPLADALVKIEELLESCVSRGHRLAPIDCYDIVMHASNAVLAGGIRRSATICMFSKDDKEMAEAKTGDWYVKNPQRGRSNNSAVLLRDSTTREEFAELMKSVRAFGEPGFVWADSTEIMYNPCVEIGLYPAITYADFNDLSDDIALPPTEFVNADGTIAPGAPMISGWAFCNLCEINMAACDTPEKWAEACAAAAIIGTLQAGYTRFDYLLPESEAIAKREALLGVSMTGVMDNPKLALDPVLQNQMAAVVLAMNAELAPQLGIRPTARATCVKPAGTTSLILGTASGIHAHHSRRYFRSVQGNTGEPCLDYYEAHNPAHVEASVWGKAGLAKRILFAVEAPDGAITKDKITAVGLLKHVQSTQQNWVNAGRVLERCSAPFLSHNVSNTITVKDHEWDEVEAYIFNNRADFAGISLLGATGDLDYRQAPMCRVLSAEELVQEYGEGATFASGLIVDGLHAFSDLWSACDTVLGIGECLDVVALRAAITREQDGRAADRWTREGLTPRSPDTLLVAWLRHNVEKYDLKVDWVRRAKKFASNYLGGDLRRLTYLLKDTSNRKHWLDLARVLQPVDWTMMPRPSAMPNKQSDGACGGGKCDIV